MGYAILTSKKDTYVRFHTHPRGIAVCSLSKADIDSLVEDQEMVSRLRFLKGLDDLTVIYAIITKRFMAFYCYDKNSNSIDRIPLFVDGVEKIPASFRVTRRPILDGIVNAVSSGFEAGRNEERKNNK
jgi:hypothetical protein